MSASFPQVEMSRVYGLCHYVFAVIYDIAFRGAVAGVGNFPGAGGFIIASNHASHLDPPIIGSQTPRQVCFFARKTLWKPGFASWWLDTVGTIPVDRDGGSDVQAIKRVLQALKNEKVIILFPEGTRSADGRLQVAKPGVGLLACRTQVPVVPARIFGSFDAFGRDGKLRIPTPTDVVFGAPMSPADYDDPSAGKERYQRASERIMARIAALEKPATIIV
jgi:1-acyl-sn-glycerol-3-phosphate acyltransferase